MSDGGSTGESRRTVDAALDKQLVANAYREMYHCLMDKDASGLEDLLDDPFEFVYRTGDSYPKYDFIENVVDGSQSCFHVNHEDLDVQLNGDEAHLRGKSLVDASMFGEDRNLWPLQMDIDLSREGDSWLMTKAYATTY